MIPMGWVIWYTVYIASRLIYHVHQTSEALQEPTAREGQRCETVCLVCARFVVYLHSHLSFEDCSHLTVVAFHAGAFKQSFNAPNLSAEYVSQSCQRTHTLLPAWSIQTQARCSYSSDRPKIYWYIPAAALQTRPNYSRPVPGPALYTQKLSGQLVYSSSTHQRTQTPASARFS